MEDDAEAGDWFVEFRQVQRDVVGDAGRPAELMWTKRRRRCRSRCRVLGVLTFSSSTGWSSKSLPRAASSQRLLGFPSGDVAVGSGLASFVFERLRFVRGAPAPRRFAGRSWLRRTGRELMPPSPSRPMSLSVLKYAKIW